MQRNREAIAWAAGLFEGEGYFNGYNANGGKNPYCRAGIQNTDLSILKRFRIVVGFGTVFGPYKGWNKPRYQWVCTGFDRTQTLGAVLWEWLSPRRREEFKKTMIHAKKTKV